MSLHFQLGCYSCTYTLRPYVLENTCQHVNITKPSHVDDSTVQYCVLFASGFRVFDDDDDLLKLSLDLVNYYLLLVLSPTCRLLYPIQSNRWWAQWYQFGCLNLVLQRLRAIVMLPNLRHPSMHCTLVDAATTQYRLMADEDRPVPIFWRTDTEYREKEVLISIYIVTGKSKNRMRANK